MRNRKDQENLSKAAQIAPGNDHIIQISSYVQNLILLKERNSNYVSYNHLKGFWQ